MRESRNLHKTTNSTVSTSKNDCKISTKKPVAKRRTNAFISANLLESIPGGMNAPIARLLLVAALRCYDPGSRGEKGGFVASDDRNSEIFQSYLRTESPLVKVLPTL